MPFCKPGPTPMCTQLPGSLPGSGEPSRTPAINIVTPMTSSSRSTSSISPTSRALSGITRTSTLSTSSRALSIVRRRRERSQLSLGTKSKKPKPPFQQHGRNRQRAENQTHALEEARAATRGLRVWFACRYRRAEQVFVPSHAYAFSGNARVSRKRSEGCPA